MLRFAKYQGLGNDFIIVDRRQGGAPLAAEVVRQLCHRHYGIGADGVLSLWPEAEVQGVMQVQNADGSESAMCGNGLRCLARYLYDEGMVPVAERELILKTASGSYRVARVAADSYCVQMGRPIFDHPELPQDVRPHGEASLTALDRSFDVVALHLGNPHVVTFVGDAPEQLAERYGRALEHHAAFVARTNVSFARAQPWGFEVVVHERGVGITRACGSGACAVVVAATVLGLWPAAHAAEVRLPGGSLQITVDSQLDISMEGEAQRVFTGEVELP